MSVQKYINLEKFINKKGKIIFFGKKNPLCASPASKILDILKLMLKKDKRVILLTDTQKCRVKGIVVCGDICRLFLEKSRKNLDIDQSKYFNEIYEHPISSIMIKSVVQLFYDVPLSLGVEVMIQLKIGTIPLVDKIGDLRGVITERDIAFLLAETNFDIEVRDVMTPTVTTCSSKCTILDALKITCHSGFRRLPILQEKRLIGYLTVKDLLRYFLKTQVIGSFIENDIHAVSNEKVTSIMTTPVITIHPEASITECAKILKKYNIGGLPVLKKQELVGIITERDIVNAMTITEKQWEKKQQRRKVYPNLLLHSIV